MLEGLDHPSQAPANSPGSTSPLGLNITALYGDPTPAPLAGPTSNSDPFGLGGLDVTSSSPAPAYDFGLAMPSAGMFPCMLKLGQVLQQCLLHDSTWAKLQIAMHTNVDRPSWII